MDSPVDEIKRRLDIGDVIGQTVALKRSGRILKGLCPFHGEKTPSFVVYPDTGTWRCFGCSQGGDAFTFVMKRDGLEFGEALRALAQQAGVELGSSEASNESREHRNALTHALDTAVLFYQGELRATNGRQAREYLGERGVSSESIEQFALGFAPRQSGALLGHLRSASVSMEHAEAAGLIGHSDDGQVFERLRGRVTFPIRDADSRTIAFGARTLEQDVQPKYLNSPQTELFDKSSCFYGFDLARATVRATRTMTVVEGYMDVIIAHQYGFQNVVATLGTAITDRHVRLIRRQVETVILALDADAAGEKATRRGLDVVRESLRTDQTEREDWRAAVSPTSSSKLRLKVMTLPTGKDPDETIRSDPETWRTLAESAEPVIDFVLSRIPSHFDLSTGAGKSEAARDALPVIRDLADPIERAHYEQKLAEIVGVDRSAFAFVHSAPARSVAAVRQTTMLPHQGVDLEEYLLALVLNAGDPSIIPEDRTLRPEAAALLTYLEQGIQRGETPDETLESLETSELGPIAERVAREVVQLHGFDTTALVRERKTAVLEFERHRLYRELAEIEAALAAGPDDESGTDEGVWIPTLQHLSQRIGEIEGALQLGGRVGSMAWRSRRAREVFGA